MSDASQQLSTLTDGASIGQTGDLATASSDFQTAHDGLVADADSMSQLSAPTSLEQTQSDIVDAINTCAQAAADAQTGADNEDATEMQTAADELGTCNDQIRAATEELKSATGQ